MVHSWVGSSPVSSIHTHAASIKSGRASRLPASGSRNWKIARSLFFLLAFLILFSGLTLVRTFASTGEVSPALGEEIVVSIDSGDTLWHLAKTYKKDSIDTRQAIHLILERNGLSTSAVKPGQTIIIPARILS
jgi:hypothetical protein